MFGCPRPCRLVLLIGCGGASASAPKAAPVVSVAVAGPFACADAAGGLAGEGFAPLPQVKSLTVDRQNGLDRLIFELTAGANGPDTVPMYSISQRFEPQFVLNDRNRPYSGIPRLRTQHRDYVLYRGPIDAVTAFSWGAPQDSPNLWWPDDQAWCVATDIDLMDTYVGGRDQCIARILADGELEALRTTLDARVDIDGDTIDVPT